MKICRELAHIRGMGDRLLTVGAFTFGVVIPIAFLLIAWVYL
jgi:hypothetical protein